MNNLKLIISDSRAEVAEDKDECPDPVNENDYNNAIFLGNIKINVASQDAPVCLLQNEVQPVSLQQYGHDHTRELLLALEAGFEYGLDSPASILIKELLMQDSDIAKQWLSAVFLEHLSDVGILSGILHAISHIDYHVIYPNGMYMALSALSHKDVVVRDGGIRAFECWGSRDSIALLKNIRCQEEWLQQYLLQVIADLEKLQCDGITC